MELVRKGVQISILILSVRRGFKPENFLILLIVRWKSGSLKIAGISQFENLSTEFRSHPISSNFCEEIVQLFRKTTL